jgi:hypothetical protein
MVLNDLFKGLSAAFLMSISVGSFSQSSFADDSAINASFEEAKGLYSHRSATDLTSINQALEKLGKIEGKAEDSDLNYDILILESQSYYWKASHTAAINEKVKFYEFGQAKADAASALVPEYAEGYYFAGINLARWAEARGVLASLNKEADLRKYMNNVTTHFTKDEKKGETLDGYGADRVFGRIYFKLPSAFGGSVQEALKHQEKAYQNAKDYVLNSVYLAESLSFGDASHKARAKQILDDVISAVTADPVGFNPNRVPETNEEVKEAKKLRAQL